MNTNDNSKFIQGDGFILFRNADNKASAPQFNYVPNLQRGLNIKRWVYYILLAFAVSSIRYCANSNKASYTPTGIYNNVGYTPINQATLRSPTVISPSSTFPTVAPPEISTKD